jgi:hypothetical protein
LAFIGAGKPLANACGLHQPVTEADAGRSTGHTCMTGASRLFCLQNLTNILY